MKTQVPAPAGSPEGDAPASGAGASSRRHAVAAAFGGAAALLAVVVVVVPFFASTYAVHGFHEPLGWDTPKYLWKTALASHAGVTSLPDRLPPPVNGSPDRPAFAVVALVAGRALGIDPARVAEALPIAMAAAIGLACAGLVTVGFGLRRWQAAVVGASVGASAWVARMAGPETYQDNLMVAAVVLAVAALAVAAAVRGSGVVAPALLLGGAALVHWSFALLFAAILAVAAVVLIGRSRRARRDDGVAPLRTESGTLLSVAAGGAAAGAVAVYGVLGAGAKAPKTSPQARAEYDKKVRHDLGRYAPWLTLPGAALGAWALWRDGADSADAEADTDRGASAGPADGDGNGQRGGPAARRRVAFAVLGAWAGIALVAGVVAAVGATVPTHRFLAFALPVPLVLAAGAVVLPGVLGRRWSTAGRAAGVVVAVALLAGGAVAAQALWSGVRPQINAELDREVRDAAAYLDRADVPASTPVVFVANAHGNPGVAVALFAHTIRAALPADRIEHAYMYLGDPAAYLAGHPTVLRPVTPAVADYDGTSWRYFRDVRQLLRRETAPVALLLPAANPDKLYLKAWAKSHDPGPNGLWVVDGPADPASPLLQAQPDGATIPAGAVGWSSVALLALVWIAGSGWSLAATGRADGFTGAALAPAIGVAVVVTAGVIADRAGVGLGGGGGIAVLLVAAAAGWALAVLSGRLRAGADGAGAEAAS